MKKVLIILICLFCLKSFSQLPLTNASGAGLWTGSAYLAKPFIPTDLSNLKLWFKADGILTKDVNNYVSQWNDASTGGYNVTQGTGANQPLWVNNVLNGKPVLRFTRKNWLSTYDLPKPQGSYTMFIVFSQHDYTDRPYIAGACNNTNYDAGGDGSTYLSWYCWSDNQIGNWFSNSNFSSYLAEETSTSTISLNVPTIMSSVFINGVNNIDLYKNGNLLTTTKLGTGATTITSSQCYFSVGRLGNSDIARYHFDGDIAEVIIYYSALSSSDRQKVENYLNKKYNIY